MQNPDDKRLLRWMHRLIAVLGAGLVLIVVLALNGYHTGWVGVLMSFTFAEMTRRISGESNPNGPMSWWAIISYAWGKDLRADQPSDDSASNK